MSRSRSRARVRALWWRPSASRQGCRRPVDLLFFLPNGRGVLTPSAPSIIWVTHYRNDVSERPRNRQLYSLLYHLLRVKSTAPQILYDGFSTFLDGRDWELLGRSGSCVLDSELECDRSRAKRGYSRGGSAGPTASYASLARRTWAVTQKAAKQSVSSVYCIPECRRPLAREQNAADSVVD